jgi:hypothetical protein
MIAIFALAAALGLLGVIAVHAFTIQKVDEDVPVGYHTTQVKDVVSIPNFSYFAYPLYLSLPGLL